MFCTTSNRSWALCKCKNFHNCTFTVFVYLLWGSMCRIILNKHLGRRARTLDHYPFRQMKLLRCVDRADGWLPTCLPNCLDKYQRNKDDLVWESGGNETGYLRSVWPVYIMIGTVINYHLSFSELNNNKKCHVCQLFVSLSLNDRLPLSRYERYRAISAGLHLGSKGTAVCGLDIQCWWLRPEALMNRYQTWYPNKREHGVCFKYKDDFI